MTRVGRRRARRGRDFLLLNEDGKFTPFRGLPESLLLTVDLIRATLFLSPDGMDFRDVSPD